MMKKMFFSIVILAIIFVGIVSVKAANEKTDSSSEVENNESQKKFIYFYGPENAILNDDAVLLEDVSAKMGKYVRIENSGSVKWQVEIPEDGRYEFYIGYRATDGDKAEKLIINSNERGVGFPISFNEFSEIRLVYTLQKGLNTIEISKDYANIDINYLRFNIIPRGEIVPLEELPTVTPKRGSMYKDNLNDLYVLVNRNGHKLDDVYIGDKKLQVEVQEFPFKDDSVIVKIDKSNFIDMGEGKYKLIFVFNDSNKAEYELSIAKKSETYPLNIVVLDVLHGNSVFIKLPTGKTLLVDSGKEEAYKGVVEPFLDRHGINNLDYYFITHYHDDHCGGKDSILEKYKVKEFKDYKSFKSGDEFEFEGTKMKILNAYGDGDSENGNSLSFRMEYNGFVYTHGSDIYGQNQAQIIKRFPEYVKADVYFTNHHLHGSTDANYLIKTNPYLFITSAEKAVYERGAYTQIFKENAVKYLKANNGRLIEDLLTFEVGSVAIKVKGENDWIYETYKMSDFMISGL